MPDVLKPVTTCKICGHKFTASPLDVPIIGEPVTAQSERFVNALAKHIYQKHRPESQHIAIASKQLYGFLTMLYFDTEDRALLQLVELIRYDLHRSTRKISISDNHISKAMNAVEGLSEEQRARTELLIRDLRDLLTDEGQYAPQRPEVAALAT